MASQQQERLVRATMQTRLCRLCIGFHFVDVTSIRSVMAQTGAVISGSAALAMLQPHMNEPSDVDFYVPPRGLAQLLKFVQAHGYELAIPPPGEEHYPSRIVLKLVHPVSASRVDIVVPTEGVVEEVTRFHSTMVMNYITHYGVVSLYPSLTMSRVGVAVKNGREESSCIQKYRDRGYTIVNDSSTPAGAHKSRGSAPGTSAET